MAVDDRARSPSTTTSTRTGLDRRASTSRRRRRYREEVADLGEPRVNLDRALALAARLEDEETLRKLEQRK